MCLCAVPSLDDGNENVVQVQLDVFSPVYSFCVCAFFYNCVYFIMCVYVCACSPHTLPYTGGSR